MTLSELMMSLEVGIIYGIIAMGIYLTFRIIDFPDLTCDGSFVLGSACSSILIQAGFSPWLALFAAIISGGIVGAVTGMLHITCKITSLLSGILTAFMLYSINLRIMGGVPNIGLIGFKTIFSDNALIITGIIFLAAFLLLSYIFSTDFGLAIRSVGQNKKLAQNYGINSAGFTIISVMLSNSLISLGGGIFSQYQGFADIASGAGTVIIGFASVIIGEYLLPFRSIWVKLISCLLGSIIYRLFITLALHGDYLGIETQDLNLITGLMIITMMTFYKRGRSC
jgi:putative tryptophan/tyrosine transport system permease protein